MYTQSKVEFSTFVQAGTVLNNYAHIFDILIRLRQACDHPYLVIFSEKNKKEGAYQGVAAVHEEELECGLCHDLLENITEVDADSSSSSSSSSDDGNGIESKSEKKASGKSKAKNASTDTTTTTTTTTP